jgi:hypothetical protein
MTEADDSIEIEAGTDLHDLFPGYYPPSNEHRRRAYQTGLVSLDANALLDTYRFTAKSRAEFFQVLEALGKRLFLTHQAALEFHRDRLKVVQDRLGAAQVKCDEVSKALLAVKERVAEFANRHQIDVDHKERLMDMVDVLESTLKEEITEIGTYDLSEKDVRHATDAVITRINTIFVGRVGPAMTAPEMESVVSEAERRRSKQIPPGYADNKPSAELRAGDYIVWRQLITEAAKHDGPILLVTNERKEDWLLKDSSGKVLGPRPELVLEMQQEASSSLHVVNVVGLLKEAREYLGSAVSDTTIAEAESLPSKRKLDIAVATDEVSAAFAQMPKAEQEQFLASFIHLRKSLEAGGNYSNLRRVINSSGETVYRLRFSPSGRADLRIEDMADDDGLVTRVTICGLQSIGAEPPEPRSSDTDDAHNQASR